jgi:uncharacterized protein YqfA (UPF0365 family)
MFSPARRIGVATGRAGLDEDEDHLHREAAAHAPGVFEVGGDVDREVDVGAALGGAELDEVERAGLVDAVGRVGVVAGALVVAARVGELDGVRGAAPNGDEAARTVMARREGFGVFMDGGSSGKWGDTT